MKHRSFLILCFLGMCMPIILGMAEPAQNVPAVIDGENADRVHLRAGPSVQSKSLGLYFTGTELLCASDPTQEWTKVVVGSQEGYMKSEYLRLGDDRESVQSKQPLAAIRAKNWVNLRSAPSKEAPVAGRLYPGDAVTLLGETSEHWGYVQFGDQCGYVMSQFYGIHEEVQASSDKKELYYDQYLASFPFEGSARAFYGIGVLDAGAAESVNLREFGDDTSPSWGEYYTGTKAVCVSDPNETWVSVWIGNETGVIHRGNICFDTDKAESPPFRYGEVLNDTLLSADSFSDTTPTFAGEEHLKKGQMITLLGRTSNGHYLADSGKGWGYVRCDNVKMVNELSQN